MPKPRICQYHSLLGGITFAAQAIPHIPTNFSVAWSVPLSSVTFMHSAKAVW